MEGHFTRKNQEMADIKRQFDAVRDALTPYEQEFAQSGLDYAGAVRQLASWHNALKSGGKAAVLQLASSYGIDLDADDEYVDPAMRQTQAQLAEIKAQLARNTAEAQQARRAELAAEIKNFQTATDSEGKILHPHFDALETDIAQLFEAGMCSSLEEGYKKALRLRDDLAAPKPRTAVKGIDPAEKVKQAKRAATGVKSSGAVGKKDRGKMTLEEEIASHFQS
jgi:oligoendopeptidase F